MNNTNGPQTKAGNIHITKSRDQQRPTRLLRRQHYAQVNRSTAIPYATESSRHKGQPTKAGNQRSTTTTASKHGRLLIYSSLAIFNILLRYCVLVVITTEPVTI